MSVCRLCSSSTEQIFDVFHAQLSRGQQIRLSIFLATGIQIKETDLVSKMVCQRCCEIAIKLHKYRINAIINDKLLKEQCGQPYTPPVVNQDEILRVAAVIASEQFISNSSCGTSAIHSQSKDSVISEKNDPNKHASIHKLYKEYENIILPEEVFNSDISPVISLNSAEVNSWYVEQANIIQSRLTSLVIKKISSDAALTAGTYEGTVIPEKDEVTTNVSNEPLVSENAMDTSCNSTASDNDSHGIDKGEDVSNCQNENDASTINTTHNTSGDETVQKQPIPVMKILIQKSRKKPGRKSLTTRKRSVSDDEDEVIPEKKIRGFKIKDSINVLNQIHLSKQLPKDKIQQKNIFSSPLELASIEVPVSTNCVILPGPSHLESTLVSSAFPSSSLVSSTATPSISSEIDPHGLLFEHADRKHVMLAEQTLPVFFCSVCNKLCYSEQQLKYHEKVHLKCKFCKIRVKSIKSLNRHLSESCFTNVIKNLPNLQLTRVEYIPEAVEKYPEAFEELFTLKDASSDLDEDPIIMNNTISYNSKAQNVNNNTSEVSELEVVCLLDDSDDEIECSNNFSKSNVGNPSVKTWNARNTISNYGVTGRNKTSITTAINTNMRFTNAGPAMSLPKSTNTLGEREMIHSLFMKNSHTPVESTREPRSDILPKNRIWSTDSDIVTIDNFVTELRKFKIPVDIELGSKTFAKFENKPPSATLRIIESWVDKRVIDVKLPQILYGSISTFQTNINVSKNKTNAPQTNKTVILNGKQLSLPIAKPNVVMSAPLTINKPIIKVNSVSKDTTKTTSANNNSANKVTSKAVAKNPNINITQTSTSVPPLVKSTSISTTAGPSNKRNSTLKTLLSGVPSVGTTIRQYNGQTNKTNSKVIQLSGGTLSLGTTPAQTIRQCDDQTNKTNSKVIQLSGGVPSLGTTLAPTIRQYDGQTNKTNSKGIQLSGGVPSLGTTPAQTIRQYDGQTNNTNSQVIQLSGGVLSSGTTPAQTIRQYDGPTNKTNNQVMQLSGGVTPLNTTPVQTIRQYDGQINNTNNQVIQLSGGVPSLGTTPAQTIRQYDGQTNKTNSQVIQLSGGVPSLGTIPTQTIRQYDGQTNKTNSQVIQLSSGIPSLGTTSAQTVLQSQQSGHSTSIVSYPTLIVPQGNLVELLQNNQQAEKIFHVSNNANTKYVVLASQNVQQLPPLVYSTNNLPASTYQPTIQISQAAQQSIVTSANSTQPIVATIQSTNSTTQPPTYPQAGLLRVKNVRELMGSRF